jgi:hypothetical protein
LGIAELVEMFFNAPADPVPKSRLSPNTLAVGFSVLLLRVVYPNAATSIATNSVLNERIASFLRLLLCWSLVLGSGVSAGEDIYIAIG